MGVDFFLRKQKHFAKKVERDEMLSSVPSLWDQRKDYRYTQSITTFYLEK